MTLFKTETSRNFESSSELVRHKLEGLSKNENLPSNTADAQGTFIENTFT